MVTQNSMFRVQRERQFGDMERKVDFFFVIEVWVENKEFIQENVSRFQSSKGQKSIWCGICASGPGI